MVSKRLRRSILTSISALALGIGMVGSNFSEVSAADCEYPIGVKDEGELNKAIDCFNAETVPDTYIIFFDSDIPLNSSSHTINNPTAGIELIIEGEGHVLDGQEKFPVRPITIAADTVVTINNLAVVNGRPDGNGGGIYNEGDLTLKNVIVAENVVPQPIRQGGGIWNSGDLDITDNSSIQGNGAGRGGGIANISGVLSLNNTEVKDNVASSTGGGIYSRPNFTDGDGHLFLFESTIHDNDADSGGGIYLIGTDLGSFIQNSTIDNNSAANGGGILTWSATLTVINTTVSENTATSQGGGFNNRNDGFDDPTYVSLIYTTVSHNSAGFANSGGGIYNTADFRMYASIVAEQVQGGNCKGFTGFPQVITSTGFNLDDDNTCDLFLPSDKSGANADLGTLQNNGGPTETVALHINSDAINGGAPASAFCASSALVAGRDQRGYARLRGGVCDIGAYESQVFPLAAGIFVSSTTSGNATGVSFTDEDIMMFNPATGTWARFFDGSDVGLAGNPAFDVDAFTILDDGSLIFSFPLPGSLPGVGAFDDSDLIRFNPIQVGVNTAGTFSMYFDGSDVGLDTNKEDIDAVSVLDDGRIVLSTLGAGQVLKQFGNTLNVLDEDLFVFVPSSLGLNTSGYFQFYFDSSDINLDTPVEDVWGATVDETNNDIYLTTLDAFDTGVVSGDLADIMRCRNFTGGVNSGCVNQSVSFNGSANDFAGERIDAIHVISANTGSSLVATDEMFTDAVRLSDNEVISVEDDLSEDGETLEELDSTDQ
ncbi:MAG: choice-of-anchor Q domain-containing protein [Chloroflexota bacterium]